MRHFFCYFFFLFSCPLFFSFFPPFLFLLFFPAASSLGKDLNYHLPQFCRQVILLSSYCRAVLLSYSGCTADARQTSSSAENLELWEVLCVLKPEVVITLNASSAIRNSFVLISAFPFQTASFFCESSSNLVSRVMKSESHS